MTVSRFKTILPGDARTVWDIVTGVMEYPAWRSDVERVEAPGAQNFLEYTKGGYVTKFTIIGEEPSRRWTLAMENANMTGRWVGKEMVDAAICQTVFETPAGAVCGRPARGAGRAAGRPELTRTKRNPPGCETSRRVLYLQKCIEKTRILQIDHQQPFGRPGRSQNRPRPAERPISA